MTKLQVNKYGTKRWFNRDRNLHSNGGNPAVEYSNGDKEWYRNGNPHRGGDKPAVEHADGYKAWYRNGKRHRKGNRPAVEWADGYKEWYKNGKRVDAYYANFGCFKPGTREEALERLNAKKRPYSRELYMADINKVFPEKAK